MSTRQEVQIDPLGYLFAPLVPPTLNILFVPALTLLAGNPQYMITSAVWMMVAWLGLEAFCLATLIPVLWLLKKHLIRVPIRPKYALAFSIALSGLASHLLFSTPRIAHFALLSWLAAAASASLAFLGYQNRSHFSNIPLNAKAG